MFLNFLPKAMTLFKSLIFGYSLSGTGCSGNSQSGPQPSSALNSRKLASGTTSRTCSQCSRYRCLAVASNWLLKKHSIWSRIKLYQGLAMVWSNRARIGQDGESNNLPSVLHGAHPFVDVAVRQDDFGIRVGLCELINEEGAGHICHSLDRGLVNGTGPRLRLREDTYA